MTTAVFLAVTSEVNRVTVYYETKYDYEIDYEANFARAKKMVSSSFGKIHRLMLQCAFFGSGVDCDFVLPSLHGAS